MKILYVITGLGMGGAERVVCDLADKMYEEGHDVKIAYLTGDVLMHPLHNDIELMKLNLNGFSSLLVASKRLSILIKKYNPDVVHAHMFHANILTRITRITTPIKKLINTAHSSNEGGVSRMMLYRATHNLSDLNTNVSNTAVDSFELKRAVPRGTMKTIYNGVNFNRFRYCPNYKVQLIKELSLETNIKIVLAVGSFNTSKNYPNLLKSIKYLKDNSSFNFICLIAGDGPLRVEIESLIGKLGLAEEVFLLGKRNDITKLMSACDVFVLSSDFEGLPTVLIEAIACEANVVSTDVSGVREILGKYGKVVPPSNSLLLSNAIKDTLIIESRNTKGLSYVKSKFDINKISEHWLKVYNEK